MRREEISIFKKKIIIKKSTLHMSDISIFANCGFKEDLKSKSVSK